MPGPRASTRRGGHFLSTVVLTGSVALAGVAGTLIAATGVISAVQKVPDVSAVLSPPSATVENFLLVGSDSRANSDPSSPDYGGIGSEADVQGTRSDTIMVLRRDRQTGSASLLSIPRDLWVEVPGRGRSRINSAYNDGPAVLVQTVQGSLDIPVHHYVEVDFNGFKSLVDAVGGVQICFSYPTRDLNTGLNIVEPGCPVLDGVQALAYARSRHYETLREDAEWHEDGTADLGRTKRQQQFVNEAMKTALARVKANPFTAGDVLASGAAAIRIDDETDVLAAAASMRSAVGDGLSTWSLPVLGEAIDGKAVLVLAEGADEVLAYFRGEGDAPSPPV